MDATVDFLFNGLEEVGAPDLSPVLVRQVAEGKHVISVFDYLPFGPGQAFGQRAGQVIPAGLDFNSLLLGEHLGQRGGDHFLMVFGNRCSMLRAKLTLQRCQQLPSIISRISLVRHLCASLISILTCEASLLLSTTLRPSRFRRPSALTSMAWPLPWP